MKEIMAAEPMDVMMLDKDDVIDALAYCIEMPEQTELDCERIAAYKKCLENLGIIRQKNS